METALVRQPRVSPARPQAGGAIRVTLGLAGTVLAASVVVLQPFGASHLFPGRTVSSPASPTPAPPGDVAAATDDLPIATEPASKSPRRSPASATADRVPEPPPEPPGSAPASQPTGPAAPEIAVAATRAAEPAPHAPTSQPVAVEKRDPRAAPAPLGSGPLIPPARPPVASLGAPLPPREPLPLQTDLIAPASPLGSPGAGSIARPGPVPPMAPAAKPVATDRHG